MSNPLVKKDKQYVIVDTCIIQHLGNAELAEKIFDDLRNVSKLGYDLAISDFTYFELLDGASAKIEEERIDALSGFSRYFVSKKILITAAHLGCLFKYDKVSSDIGDKIIGATTLLYNAIVYTTNGRDFPRPFFKELSKSFLKYSKNRAEITLPVYFLRPDLEYINLKYKEINNFLEMKSPESLSIPRKRE